MHKFDPKNIQRLERPERKKKFPPDIISNKLKIKEGDTVADIGCGSGFFTLPISDRAGSSGKVYAIDISKEMLEVLKKKIGKRENIEPVLSDENEFPVEKNTIDLVFMGFILHESVNKKTFINKSVDLLKKDGRVAVLDYEKRPTESGPPVEDRVDKEEVKTFFRDNGLGSIEDIPISDEAYFMIFGRAT